MADHTHRGFEIGEATVDASDDAEPVNYVLLGEFMGAAFDRCTSCQDALTTLIAADPSTTARLVELACVTLQDRFGTLPANMSEDGPPGAAAPEFRRLVRAALDGENPAM